MKISFYKPTLYQVWLHMAEDSVCHPETNVFFVCALPPFFISECIGKQVWGITALSGSPIVDRFATPYFFTLRLVISD